MKAPKLEQLFPLLHELGYADRETSRPLWGQQDRLWEDFANRPPEARAFMNSNMHDSHLLSAARDGYDFVLSLNDISFLNFCAAVLEKRGHAWPWPWSRMDYRHDLISPVWLRFHHVLRCDLCRISGAGKMLPISLSRYIPRLDELLYDEARLLNDDLIDIAFLFWSNRKVKGDHYLVLRVKSKRLWITHDLQASYIRFCPEEAVPLFDSYMRKRIELGHAPDLSEVETALQATTDAR